jgi:hypothetical protein
MSILQNISQISVIFDEIQQNLPDASSEQVQRFTAQVKKLHQVKDYFEDYAEDLVDFQASLAKALKALDHTTPYRIAVIGRTGRGKSTFINALLARDLVLKKDAGKPATGAALEIFFIEEYEKEVAIVIYRSEANIRELIKDFITRYGLNFPLYRGQIDTKFLVNLQTIQPAKPFTQSEEQDTFMVLRNTLVDMVDQFIKHPNLDSRTFDLNNQYDCEYLLKLTDEHSELNSKHSPERVISLIQAVTYKIKTNYQSFHLPKNVCLVDLPGLDGSPLHNIIIRDGIKGADAVIYLHQPQRVDTSDDLVLFNNIKRYISIEESKSSYEGIFFVLNARDSITADKIPPELNTAMCELINNFLPNYTSFFANRDQEGNPYFLISALAALEAQKSLRGEALKDPRTYRQLKVGLGLSENAGDQIVLEASRLPHLVTKLMQFAREGRVERQITDGQTALNTIIQSLLNKYEREKEQLNRKLGQFSLEEKEEQILREKEEKLKDIVITFRCNQSLEKYKIQLTETAKIICNEIDKALKNKLPELWEGSIQRKRSVITGEWEVKFFSQKLLEGVQKQLWHELTDRMMQLSEQLVGYYYHHFRDQRIATQIAQGCYETLDSRQIEERIQIWIKEKMQFKLREFASRIAIGLLANSQKFDWMNKNISQSESELRTFLEILKEIPPQLNLNPEQFNILVSAIRQQYEPYIVNFSTEFLLNLYWYEMIVIEEELLKFIRSHFYKLRSSSDVIIKGKIRDSFSQNPEWQKLEIIERKLMTLRNITNITV